ncbi:hypothetical protein WN55_05320 [Dufourea novaeangliae]|uniref:Uncharacterized protein n=1 Tax=Dufourea novaeangliae TaxID=178035 RepID=A0A154NXU9_DUFNO|nr:hypothetical protein WN55_05320 [Dufourea novaeangliae]
MLLCTHTHTEGDLLHTTEERKENGKGVGGQYQLYWLKFPHALIINGCSSIYSEPISLILH